jgi:beta-glucanase (GH16 family)
MEINLTKVLDPSMNHNLSYMGGMISTWNKASQLFLIFRSSIDGRLKFCFTGGLIVTNVMMPGITNIFGLWPAVWTCVNSYSIYAEPGLNIRRMWANPC